MNLTLPVLLTRLFGTLIALTGMVGANAAEVRLAVAANFSAPLQLLVAAFEKSTGHKALVSLGASGALYSQIRNGAPFDVLLSADGERPEQLEREGNAVAGSRFTYAIGRLALWSARAELVDAQGSVLRHGGFQRLAIAAPKLAPYGAAAMQVLTALGLPSAESKFTLVTGESIGQAYSFIASGNAELGFVALSQVWEKGRLKSGSMWLVPAALHAPIRQDAVLLQHGRTNAAALAWMQYLATPQAGTVIRAHGYDL
jgi:molybdate transport system substrate-binding protein